MQRGQSRQDNELHTIYAQTKLNLTREVVNIVFGSSPVL